MDLLAMLARPLLPGGDRPFIQPVGLHDGLPGAAIGQQRHHDHDQLRGLAQPFQHRATARTKGLSTYAIALPLAIMKANVALSGLASCGTRQIQAKSSRRVHRLVMVLLHKHIMPRRVTTFKSFPHFHRLVGLYPWAYPL